MAFDFPRRFTTRDSIQSTARWKLPDGTFPWSDFSYVYRIADAAGCERLKLTEGDGIEIDPEQNLIQFTAPADWRLCAGAYTHGCTITYLPTGQDIQFFTGQITISEAP